MKIRGHRWGECLVKAVVIMAAMCTTARAATTYYVSPAGADNKSGTSIANAWQTINKVNNRTLVPGDTVLFEGGQTFVGRIVLNASASGTSGNPITIGSYTSAGQTRATIDGGCDVWDRGGIVMRDLILTNSNSANTDYGMTFYSTKNNSSTLAYLRINNLDISGFGRSGIVLGTTTLTSDPYDDVSMTNLTIHDNKDVAINTWSVNGQLYRNRNFYIGYCRVYNNAQGFILASLDTAVIERNTIYSNGYSVPDCNGIDVYDSRYITIQYNEVYDNRTTSHDGNGICIDRNTMGSVIQYNYTHDNWGTGLYLAQWPVSGSVSSDEHHDNTIRYNVSQNDAIGIRTWGRIINAEIYGNTVFLSPRSGIIGLEPGTPVALLIGNRWFDYMFGSNPLPYVSGIHVRNNIFMTTGNQPLIYMEPAELPGATDVLFQNNDYYTSGGTFTITWGNQTYNSLSAWRTATGQEMLGGSPVGYDVNPMLTSPGTGGTIGYLNNINTTSALPAYVLSPGSPMKDAGINLFSLFGVNMGAHDYYSNSIPVGTAYSIGAYDSANHAPTVTANGSPTNGTAPLLVNFTASGVDVDGDTLSYAWTFGDGQSSASQNPSHTYAATGSYTATVTVSDPSAASGQATVQITATAGIDPDTDGDGLLDSVDPDDDNDGMSDADEAVAGTIPTNGASLLVLYAPTVNPGSSSNIVIRWQSVSDHQYTVQAATNLLTGFGPIPGASNIQATYPENVYTDETATVIQKFYKVKLETGN